MELFTYAEFWGTVAVLVLTLPYRITTGTVTDSGSVYTGLLGAISGYIYRTGEL